MALEEHDGLTTTQLCHGTGGTDGLTTTQLCHGTGGTLMD